MICRLLHFGPKWTESGKIAINFSILYGPSVFKLSLLWIFNSFDKDVHDSSYVEPPLLGLQNFQDGAYAEDLANFHERSHADDW
jgi:hypothetical protein